MAIVGLGVLTFVVGGCGSAHTSTRSAESNRSILRAGYTLTGQYGPSPSDAAAKRDVNGQIQRWRAGLSTYYPGSSEPAGLSRHQFRLRLAAAAARYHFKVKRVQFIHARVLAPFVIVQTRHYLALSRAISVFEPSICPGTCAEFFEAQDESGVPFIATGSGQWARSEALYPYPHG